MKYRRIDKNGDYVFGGGLNDFIKDKAAFAQACKTKLRLYYGQWWEDLSEGLPFYEEIAGRFLNSDEEIDIVSQIFQKPITQIQGFQSFQSIENEFDKEKRKFTLRAQINTQWGQTEKLELV